MTEKTIAESSRRGNEVREDEIDLLMLASHFADCKIKLNMQIE